MTVVFGLAAALGWGVTDLLARFSGRAIGVTRAMFFAQLSGLVIISAWLALDPGIVAAALARAAWPAWLAGLLAAPIILAATFSLFRALAVGTLGIVSPITASYGAITTALSAASGEVLGSATVAGIAATVAGVALASTPAPRTNEVALRDGPRPLRGTGWALVASACYGLGSWLQGALAVPTLGYVVPVWLYYFMGVVGLAFLARMRRQGLKLPHRGVRFIVLGTGLCSVAAYVSFSAGLATGHVSVVTVLSTLSSGIAALLGRIVLGERLAFHQWAGVAAILAGIALINGAR